MTALRIDYIAVDGFGPLRDVRLDLQSMPGVVAVSGPNGSGKTTAIEAILGAMYRSMPSRGKLADVATKKGATLELRAHNGVPITAGHVVDATHRTVRQESILQIGSEPPTDGKVKSFDEAAAAVFPPEEVFLASAFSAQGGMGNFADLSRDERRQVLQRLLGLERLQLIADAAKDMRKDLEEQVRVLEGRLADLPSVDLGALREALEMAGLERAAYETQGHELRGQIQEARVEHARAEAEYRLLERKLEEWQEGKKRLARLTLERTQAEKDLQVSHRAAGARGDLQSLLATGRQVQREIDDLRAVITEKEAEVAVKREKWDSNHKDLILSEKEMVTIQGVLARAIEIRAAADRIEDLRRSLADAEGVLAKAEEHEQGIRAAAERHAAALAEVKRLDDLISVAVRSIENLCATPFGAKCIEAGCPFVADAAGAKERLDGLRAKRAEAAQGLDPNAGDDLASAQRLTRAAKDRVTSARRDLDAARAAASDLALLEDAEPRARRLQETIDASRALEGTLTMTGKAMARELSRLKVEKQELEGKLSAHHPGGLDQTARLLAQAEAEAEQLKPRQERVWALTDEIKRAEASLGEEPSDEAARARVDRARMDLADLEEGEARQRRAMEEAGRKMAGLEEQIRQAEDADTRRREHEGERTRLLGEAADWTLIEKGFGKDGVQALLVDAAGPAISGLCNQLLEVMFGSRFRVSLETTRLDSTGKRLIETLDLRVLDCERGREGSIETLSGGERVVVGLALRLALCLHGGAGQTSDMLVLDEMDGALDPINASHFVEIIRRAMEIGSIRQVLFVSHRDCAVDAADHVIRVENGSVRVER